MSNFFTVQIDTINRAEALNFLAYKGEPTENLSAVMDKCEKRLLAAVRGKFTFRVFDISPCEDGISLSGSTMKLTGHDISSLLEGCTKAALICATAGADVDKLIRAAQVSDMAEAVVIDAMAGCAVESVCDAAEEKIRAEYPAMFMTWRYSPGYGDLPITLQKQFLDVTNASRLIGLCTNDSFVLNPKKSVTAIVGLSDKPLNKKKQGCTSCALRESCNFRKKGLRCYYD